MNVKTFEEVRQRFLEITFEERFDLIVAVANGGIIPAAMLNQRLNLDMQLLKLHLRVRSKINCTTGPGCWRKSGSR